MLYLLIKYLHVIAAVFLFGFGMGAYLYLIAASRSGNPVVISHVAKMVVRFDTWITTPAGVMQLVTGYALAHMTGTPLSTSWLLTSVVIFFCVGGLWLPVLVLQTRLQRRASQAAECAGSLDACYRSEYRGWFWMGVVGFAGMFVIVLMMVSKMTPVQWLSLLL